MGEKGKNKKSSVNAVDIAKHANTDATLSALRSQEDANNAAQNTAVPGMTMIGKLCIFILIPVLVGVMASYMAFLDSLKYPDKTLSFEKDFMVPFLLTLATIVVVGFRTGGFTGAAKPLIAWPKIKKVKKVIRMKKADAIAAGIDVRDKKND